MIGQVPAVASLITKYKFPKLQPSYVSNITRLCYIAKVKH